MPQYQWGAVTNTNGYNGYWPNPGVKTTGIGMITTRVDRDGNHPILIGTIHRGFASGPASIWQGIYYRGVETQGGVKFDESGGSFDFFIRGSAGTLQFGRCEPCGNVVQSENEAFTWGGTLIGSFDFAEVSTEPHVDYELVGETSFHFDGWDVASNGGSEIYEIRRQMSVDIGAWGSTTTNWGGIYEAAPGHTYQFRFSARNGVGDSEWFEGPIIEVEYGGGRRIKAGGSAPLTIARRLSATPSTWKDLTTKKRFNGAAFVNINN